MASPCHWRNKHPRPSAIRFFKIILRESLREGKLRIPNNFARKYGVGLSNPMFLKPPDGTEWKVYWTKHGGEIWFQKGWKEFARYYSLGHGHLVLFEYEGTSHLEVHIFDMSALEIDYPNSMAADNKKDNHEEIRDDSVEILDELPPCQKTRPETPMSSPQPQKKLRTGTTGDVEKSSNSQNLPQHVQTNGIQSPVINFEKSTIASVKQELDDDMGGRTFTTGCPKVEQLTSTKINEALNRATTFRSKNPSFMLVMKRSYADGYSLNIPSQFVEKYLKTKQGVILLQVLDGRTWSAIYGLGKINAGWKKFASDNNLRMGDACVFELIKSRGLSFKVFIFQVAEEPSWPQPQGGDASQRTSLLISPHPSTTGALKGAKKFTSENPFFIINIRQSHLGTTRPRVPSVFVRKYFENKRRNLMIQFGKKLWPVKLAYDGYKASGKFSAGWSQFREESKYQAGDVCIFELINREDAVLDVHLFRGHS